MSLGTHPDTMTMARAKAMASRSGHVQGSLGWWKAYRKAYGDIADPLPGLDELLGNFDGVIASMEEEEKGQVNR